MSLVAILPVASLSAANATLQAAGFGPGNFSVPAYAQPGPTHGALHAWPDAAFEAAVMLLGGVVMDNGEGDPIARTQALIAAQGAQWGAQAPPLPDAGVVIAGSLYAWGERLWWVIQQHDRGVFGGDPAQYPALIRRVHVPGEVEPWQQPLDQYDAYKLLNAFTGAPDRCTHNGSTWAVSQADGAGNNIWEPGVFGWVQV